MSARYRKEEEKQRLKQLVNGSVVPLRHPDNKVLTDAHCMTATGDKAAPKQESPRPHGADTIKAVCSDETDRRGD